MGRLGVGGDCGVTGGRAQHKLEARAGRGQEQGLEGAGQSLAGERGLRRAWAKPEDVSEDIGQRHRLPPVPTGGEPSAAAAALLPATRPPRPRDRDDHSRATHSHARRSWSRPATVALVTPRP